ncbi:MAG: acyloxyacyl hydrolase [Desulfarculus sp.]|nr:acyloxyacyl hydrolase [Desulfarculus sp.]
MHLIRGLLSCLLFLAMLAACPARAQSSPAWETGFDFFFHQSIDIDRRDLRGAGLLCHWDRPLWTGRWYRLDLRLEFSAGGMNNYADGLELGLVPGLRTYFYPGGSWQPFLEAGVGPSYNTMDIPELGTGFNFLSYGGLGLRLRLTAATGLEIGYRLRHVSNAGLDDHNHGVTSHQCQAGLAWEF